MLADVMNRKWRVGLLKKTPTEGEEGCVGGDSKGWEILGGKRRTFSESLESKDFGKGISS